MNCPYIDRRCGTHAQCIRCEGGESMSRVFYEGYDGRIYDRHDLTKAFCLATAFDSENEREFMKWLYTVFGKSIKSAVVLSPRELFDKGYKVLAIKALREETDCSLIESKKIVDSWEEVRQ